jgi:hypothetical protein
MSASSGIEVFTTDVEPPWKVQMLWIEISRLAAKNRTAAARNSADITFEGRVRIQPGCPEGYICVSKPASRERQIGSLRWGDS